MVDQRGASAKPTVDGIKALLRLRENICVITLSKDSTHPLEKGKLILKLFEIFEKKLKFEMIWFILNRWFYKITSQSVLYITL